MKRLGYPQFASQGGDWGGAVTNVMARQAPPELLDARRRAYAAMMGTRPQTLYGLADSPAGLAGWLPGCWTTGTAGASRPHRSPRLYSATPATDTPQVSSPGTISWTTSRCTG
jgi:hypothetical protein